MSVFIERACLGSLGKLSLFLALAALAIVALGSTDGSERIAVGLSSNASLLAGSAEGVATTQGRSFSYGWPVKPFDRQHPIRGNIGDPRTVFSGGPTVRGLLTSACKCSYHQGVDISAPDGTAVYPVRSGVVTSVTSHWVLVDSGGGVEFQYWHVNPQVRPGDQVTEGQTVLGRIVKHAKHVHLAQLVYGRVVNPLAPGNLGPYVDRTIPRVNGVEFRLGQTGSVMLPEYIHGRVEIVVDASDAPAIPVPGLRHGLPVTPGRLTYVIRNVPHGWVVSDGTSIDFSRGLPETLDIWQTYARGTHMNAVQIGEDRYWYQPGVYLFKLTALPFDTRSLGDGAYALTVTAWDTAGNHSSRTQIFSVHNRPTWLGER